MAKLSPADRDWNYEAAINRVETLVQQIEAGDLDLADVFEHFETASQDLRACETFLTTKQQQIDLTLETLDSIPECS